jgi:hypothetical protein
LILLFFSIFVVSETFKISIGITFGTKISLGPKKFGIPTANNKIIKWRNTEKKIPEFCGFKLSTYSKNFREL